MLIVLEIIGKAILVLFLILLALIFYSLFVPIHYEVSYSNRENSLLQVRVSSFFKSICFFYRNHKKYLFIFWKWKVYPKKDKDIGENYRKEHDRVHLANDVENEDMEVAEGLSVDAKSRDVLADSEESDVSDVKTERSTRKRKTKRRESKRSKKKTNRKKKVTDAFGFIKDEGNQRAIRLIIRNVIAMLRHFLPKKIWADFEFAAGEPDETGYILAFLSCIPFRNAKIKQVVPDFESEVPYFCGEIRIGGSIQLIVVLVTLIRLFIHKECRRLLHYI